MSRSPTRRFPPLIRHGAYYLLDEFTRVGGLIDTGGTTFVANRVFVAPFMPPFDINVDRIVVSWAGTCAGNVIAGIYNDNGLTPVGGSLKLSSVSVAKSGTNRRQEITVADTTLLANTLYWLAVMSNEATSIIRCPPDYTGRLGSIQGYYVTEGGFALSNPLTGGGTSGDTASIGVRVKSIP